jgi:hypothetical protein
MFSNNRNISTGLVINHIVDLGNLYLVSIGYDNSGVTFGKPYFVSTEV